METNTARGYLGNGRKGPDYSFSDASVTPLTSFLWLPVNVPLAIAAQVLTSSARAKLLRNLQGAASCLARGIPTTLATPAVLCSWFRRPRRRGRHPHPELVALPRHRGAVVPLHRRHLPLLVRDLLMLDR